MSESELISLVEEILELPAGTVGIADDLEELGWDSLSNLTFLSIADDRYKVQVDAKDLARAERPSDLALLLAPTSVR